MRILFWLFYTATVILWFKDSFPQLESIPMDFRMPLAGLIIISFFRFIPSIKRKKPTLRFRLNQSVLLIVFLAILAIAVRIPFLANHAGLSDSDDGLTMMMSKHIADGKLPPLYFYKQYYQGSLFSHLCALMISLFGYSHLLIEITILLFFCAFIAIQFLFLKKIFSPIFAFIASAFYCLPIGHLITCSFFVSSAYPLVLFLGSIILFLSYRIVYHDKTNLLPAFGFLVGLAFWTHQLSIVFILTALFMLVPKIRILWKKFLTATFYVIMGGLPLIIGEIFWNFHLIRYLMPGGGNSIGGVNFKNSFEMSLLIFSRFPNVLSYAFFALLFLGLISLIYPSIKAKKFQPCSLFSVFFLLFIAIYFVSRFGEKNVIRYFYILYFCLPVLFLGVFLIIRSKFKYFMMASAVLLIFFGLNLKGYQKNIQDVETAHRQRTQAVRAMKDTGQRYWRANFWAAYLLTALAGEEVIVDSYTVNRYFPYRLMYENEGKTENFVFITEGKNSETRLARRFPKLLEACQLVYKKKSLDGYELVYDIPTPVSPSALMAPMRSGFPDIDISSLRYEKGFLDVIFTNIGQREGSDYWIHAEIPGFSSLTKGFPAAKGYVGMRLPIPRKKSFPLEFHLSYKGMKMAQSHKKIICSLPPESAGRKKKIVFLEGIGPEVEIEGREMNTCAVQTKIEINGKLKPFTRIRLDLYSPFEFSDPAWYGDFSQEFEIQMNGETVRRIFLNDGTNIIIIPIEGLPIIENRNILSLRFKHHLFFNFAPYRKTSALLEKIELER